MESFNNFSGYFVFYELADAILCFIPSLKIRVKDLHLNLTLIFSAFFFIYEPKQIITRKVIVEAFAKNTKLLLREISFASERHKRREKNAALSPFFGLQNIETGIIFLFVSRIIIFCLLYLKHIFLKWQRNLFFVFPFH